MSNAVVALVSAIVLLSSAAASAAVLPGPVPMASAPLPATGDITVPACPGTTSDPNGTVNTPSPMVLTGTAADDVRAGKTVNLYDNKGDQITLPDGTLVNNGARVPFCGAKLDPTTGIITVDWRFCTDENLYGCSNEPASPVAGNPKLTSEQQGQIAYVLHNGDLSTKRSRALVQTQVWCISEDIAPGTVFTNAQQYWNSYQFLGDAGSGSESAPITDAEVTCAARPAVPVTPQLSVTAPTSDPSIGNLAVFTVAANFSGPVGLTVTGGATPTLCPDGQTGVSMTGNAITFAGAGTATVCVGSSQPGEVVLHADATGIPVADQLTFAWNGDESCQVFADYSVGARATASAKATITFLAASTPTPTPTSTPTASPTATPSASPTPTASASPSPTSTPGAVINSAGNLAETGGTIPMPEILAGLALCLVGLIVLLTARIRAHGRP